MLPEEIVELFVKLTDDAAHVAELLNDETGTGYTVSGEVADAVHPAAELAVRAAV